MDEKEYVKKKMALLEERKNYQLQISMKNVEIELDNRKITEIDWELTKLHELYKSCKD